MPDAKRDFHQGQRVYIAGHRGMVGSAIMRSFAESSEPGLDVELITRDHGQLDLTRQFEVEQFFGDEKIDSVYLAAARVGGILANRDHAAEFIRENLLIQTHVIDAACRCGVKRLVFLGSSCIYPRLAAQPISEDELLTGALEETNEAYAVAKIAGLKMCEAYRHQYDCDFRSLMPTNLYGPDDNFDPLSSHVLPALLRRFHEAAVAGLPEVCVWGTGEPRREFLHVDDLAAAARHVMELDDADFWGLVPRRNSHVNVGTGEDIRIADLARLIAQVTGYQGDISFDPGKPDGTPRKLLDVRRAQRLGWRARIALRPGIEKTYAWFREFAA